MREPVQERGGHLGIAKDVAPLGEREVGRDDHAGALIALPLALCAVRISLQPLGKLFPTTLLVSRQISTKITPRSGAILDERQQLKVSRSWRISISVRKKFDACSGSHRKPPD